MIRKKKEIITKKFILNEIKEEKTRCKIYKLFEKENVKLFKSISTTINRLKYSWYDKDISSKLWLPQDNQLLIPKPIINNTWFKSTIKKQKITNKLINFDINNKINKNRFGKVNDIERVKIIEIKPTVTQSIILKSWMNAYRLVYNKTLMIVKRHLINNNVKVITKKDLPDFNKTRKEMTLYINNNINLKKLIRDTKIPSNSCDNAVNDVFKHYNSCISNKHKNFNIKYKEKNHNIQWLHLEPHVWTKSNNTFCKNVLGSNIEILTKKRIINPKTYNSYIKVKESIVNENVKAKLKHNAKTNKYHLYIYKKREVKAAGGKDYNTISIDPGVRSFLTGYSDNSIIELGTNVSINIENNINNISNLQSVLDTKTNKRQQIKRKIKYLNNNISGKVKELHHKTINYLCSNYNNIIIGKIGTSSICSNDTSNLGRMQKAILYRLSHYKFRERLIAKAEEYNNKVIITHEYLTSKLCSRCGSYNDVKRSKRYECSQCNLIIDRDVNASRNILLKTLKEQKIKL